MFRSRRRAASHSAAQAPPSSAAAMAALQAAGAPRDGRLAAGAAAAALRSATTSPTPVSDVQTKRMLRRASVSSNASNTSFQRDGRPLSRSDGVAPMGSRTFRSPSPHGRQPVAQATPPVPPLPSSRPTSPSMMTKRTFRRPSSTEPPPRMASPTPRQGRNFSIDSAMRSTPKRQSYLQDIQERPQVERRNSINFSRPMSPDNRPMSPSNGSPISPQARTRQGSSMTNSPLTRGETDNIQYKMHEVANRPVQKKQGVAAHEGLHLASGTMGARPIGTAADDVSGPPISPAIRAQRLPVPPRISEEPEEDEFEEVFDPHTRTMIKRRKPGSKPRAAASPPRVASPASTSPAYQRESLSRGTLRPSDAISQSLSLESAEPVRTSARDTSGSPARAAHFFLQPDYATPTSIKHEPLRSKSPAKSALKQSPSPRGSSPAGYAGNRMSWTPATYAPSDVSDNVSQASEEGRPKRRSVRVSFDDQPTVVGTSASPPTSLDSPILASPQHKRERGWFGLKKKHPLGPDDESDSLTPTPVLPSFGSVRGKDGPRVVTVRNQDEVAAAVNAMSVAVTTGEKTPDEPGSSLDPVPPEVTSVEGTGYHSDDENEFAVTQASNTSTSETVPTIAIDPGTPGVEHKLSEPGFNTEEASSPPLTDSSPALAGIAEPEPELLAAAHDPSIPTVGHVAEAMHHQVDLTSDATSDSDDESHYSDAAEDMDGDGFGSINAIVDTDVLVQESMPVRMAEALPPLTKEPPAKIGAVPAAQAETGIVPTTFREGCFLPGAIASTAERVTSSMAGAQVAPLSAETAISEVPVKSTPLTSVQPNIESVSYNPRKAGSPSPAPPNALVPGRQQDESEWTKAESFWSDLNQRRKAEFDEQDSRPLPQSGPYPFVQKSPRHSFQETDANISQKNSPAPAAQQVHEASVGEAESPQKQVQSRGPAVAASPLVSSATNGSARSTPQRSMPQKQPLKSALKSTNRNSMPPAAITPKPKGTLAKKNRPLSMSAAPTTAQSGAPHSEAVALAQAIVKVQNDRAQQTRSQQQAHSDPNASRSANMFQRSSLAPKLRRRGSDASDSSFKRASSVTSEGGRVSMRRSMRAAPARPQSMAANGSLRGNERPSSPPTARSMSMVDSGIGARSVRQSVSLRGQSPSQSSLGIKNPGRSGSLQPSPGRSRLTSRFGNDSDDEDVPTSKLVSRFDDSDEDEPKTFRPVRGIPRRIDEKASPDLSDSSDGEQPNTIAPTSATQDTWLVDLASQRVGVKGRPEVPSLDNNQRFGQSDLVNAFAEKRATNQQPKKRSFFGALGRRKTLSESKVTKDQEESLARRDTPLERTKFERNNTGSNTTTAMVARPNAARQSTAERIATLQKRVDPNAWPLPESSATVEMRRPTTSDGTTNGKLDSRPVARRQYSADGFALGRTGKKKKFPMLRRAFGLHD